MSSDGGSVADRIEAVALPLYQGIMIRAFDPAARSWVSGTGLRAVWAEPPLAAGHATAPLFAAAGAEALPARWLGVLGLYDLVFGLLALAVFDFLVED